MSSRLLQWQQNFRRSQEACAPPKALAEKHSIAALMRQQQATQLPPISPKTPLLSPTDRQPVFNSHSSLVSHHHSRNLSRRPDAWSSLTSLPYCLRLSDVDGLMAPAIVPDAYLRDKEKPLALQIHCSFFDMESGSFFGETWSCRYRIPFDGRAPLPQAWAQDVSRRSSDADLPLAYCDGRKIRADFVDLVRLFWPAATHARKSCFIHRSSAHSLCWLWNFHSWVPS
jgi:hypothetical protein